MQFILNPKWYYKNGNIYWEDIYVFSPTILGDPIYKNLKVESIKSRVFASDKLSEKKLNEILNDAKNKKPKILIIDDFAAHLKGKGEKIINDAFFRSRHNNCSIIVLSQNYKSVPKPCRLNCTDLFIFNFSNKKEMKLIEEEQSNKLLNGDDFLEALRYCCNEKYGFMYKNNKGMFFNSKFEEIV